MNNSTIKPKACKQCGSPWHSAMYHKPRKPIQTKTVPKRTAIKKRKTRIGMEWEAFRLQWHDNNPAPVPCHYCGHHLTRKKITLDHKIPRSRAPHLRLEPSNIVPACVPCNTLKGSITHDDYKHECH